MKPYPISILPNQEGYEFIAILKDGSQVQTIVKKDEKGMHYFDEYPNSKGWLSIDKPTKQKGK